LNRKGAKDAKKNLGSLRSSRLRGEEIHFVFAVQKDWDG